MEDGNKLVDALLIHAKTHKVIKKEATATIKKPRPIGLAKEQFKVPPTFFESLPDDLINAFEGHENSENST